MSNLKVDENDRAVWYGVEDLRVRKRVQDRLAQRARRKRLSEASNDSTKAVIVSPRQRRSLKNETSAKQEHQEGDAPGLLKLPERQVPNIEAVSVRGTNHRTILIRPHPGNPPPYECTNQPTVDMTTKVIMALHANGVLLGLCCRNFEIATSPVQPLNSAAPAILHPSPLQCAVPHFDWIDRFPFPKFRDNAILLADSVDLADFVSDFYAGNSFALREEWWSWDPGAWLVDPGFLAKWGFLFK
ncbi:hypothetical protein H2200_005282 [Cladophialophora chaetospira]|uniref:Uncharacterized protein n=1 Tax=Cladophialophora chaetospira TaxID=386627 RepID=A0AA38XBP9_9EURO|nr:hypothetical protein H2200_005282 [Cladophialophora chaetospira]